MSSPSSSSSGKTKQAELGKCLRLSQLVTKIALIVFAVYLLLVAVLVVFSREVPHFMQRFELLPEVLFVLCVATATFALIKWLVRKTLRCLLATLSSLSAMTSSRSTNRCCQRHQAATAATTTTATSYVTGS